MKYSKSISSSGTFKTYTVQWRIATEVYIPKSGSPEPNNIKNFRPISLLNVQGNLFFSILSKRLEKHIYNNKLVNSSTEKGCMEKVPGCWEHMSVVWDELTSRNTERSNIADIWLDIANAYGSVPPSSWHHHLTGISIGCTASIILFLSAINVLIEHISSVTEDEIYKTMTSTPVKAFMDDMFLMSPSIPATHVLLDRCAVALIWARMSFRASKSRSMVIDRSKVIDISPFSFKGEIIPSIHANPVRFLGRTIDFTVFDIYSVEKFVTEVLSGLKLIDKSSHKGIHKVWILQNKLIPRLRWPLLI